MDNQKKEILLTEEGFKKIEDELELLKTVRRKEVAERIWHTPSPVAEYDYWLSEVYYEKRRKTPNGRSEPDSRHENPKDVVKDLQMMLKDAKRSLKEWLIFDVSDNDKPKKIRKMA